jgi:hypothetical protein
MIKINNLDNKCFFFFIDFLKEFESNSFKIDLYFNNVELLCCNKYFIPFFNNKINFSLLEENEKFLFFFIIFNKIFFKNQKKNLQICLNIEKNNLLYKKRLKLKFIFNFFFFL